MKRFILLTLSLALCLSLCACSANPLGDALGAISDLTGELSSALSGEDGAIEVTPLPIGSYVPKFTIPPELAATAAPAETPPPAVDVPSDAQAEAEAEAEVEAEAEAEATEAPVSLYGYLNGNCYTNDFIGITFDAPDGYDFMIGDELNAYYAEQGMSASNVIYDMMCVDNTDSVNVNMEDLGTAAGQYSPVSYLEVTKPQLEEAYLSMGLDVASIEITQVNIANASVPAMSTVINVGSSMMYQVQAVFAPTDRYIAIVTFTAMDQGVMDDLLNRLEKH